MPMQSLLDSEYGLSNYSICKGGLLINPTHVDRDFDVTTNTYKLLLQGDVPGITYPPVERYAIETATFEIGFWPVTHEEHFRCQNCVQHGPVYFEKVSDPESEVDIACRYQIMMDTTPIICVNVAPIGYQNTTTWRKVFVYVPIGITVLAAVVSLLCNIETALRDDLFLALSNYALDWNTLRIKGSTAADIIFYTQYVFATGALNLRYPKFYAHFTSNFAWSWLLFAPSWMIGLLEHALKSPSKRASTKSSASSKTSIAVSTNMTELALLLDIDLRGLFLTSLLFFSFFVVGLALIW
ncbi:hypothetical protein BJV82DRAFT_668529 [Fennellomyces sp. T-0311]|nr:hypothetical protein BJV82DRAFT_668529 [Fennellomyces sp. T-0311]